MKFVRKLFAGFIVALGLAMSVGTIGAVQAATVTPLAGPLSPSGMLSYLNTIIGAVNTAVAPGGAGNMSQFLSISSTTGIGQVVSAASWTTTTSVCAIGSSTTGVTGCLGIADFTGTVRWIPSK